MPRYQPEGLMGYVTMGTEFVVTGGVFIVAGVLLDRWLDTLPTLTLVGAAIGFVAATWRLVRIARRAGKRLLDQTDEQSKSSQDRSE